MQVGTQTASLVNHLYSRSTIGQPKPTVGMGVTILGWTDRYAGTIHKVSELCGKTWLYEIEVTRDDAKVISGSVFDGSAKYEYTSRPDGGVWLFRFNRKTGKWVEGLRNVETLRFNSRNGRGLRIGEREEYSDPSF